MENKDENAVSARDLVRLDYSGLDRLLDWVYGPEGKKNVWLTGFPKIEEASWFGVQGLDALRAKVPDPKKADMYLCIGQMRTGAARRAIGEVEAQPLLIVDDIGTKVPFERWEALFALGMPEPSFRVETSPGNQTWFWVLEGDAKAPQRWLDLTLIRAWLVEKKLTDNVMDEARYVRLPTGWNSKAKYKTEATDPNPKVGFVGPVQIGTRVELDAIGRVLIGRDDWRDAPMPNVGMTGVQLNGVLGVGALKRTANINNPEPLIKLAMEIGLNPSQARAGVVEALCPNMSAHSDRADTGFAFLGGGLCQCQHASCQGLRSGDFRHMMETRYDDMVAGKLALGMDLGGLPASASEFMARADFEWHGVEWDNAQAQEHLEVEAAELSARNAERAEFRAVEKEKALEELARRFVWVNPQKAFFDTKDRVLVQKDEFDSHADVVCHIPAGSTGKNRAANVIINRPDARFAYGIAFKVGDRGSVVMEMGSNGRTIECVNTWVASSVGRKVGVPTEWFELVEHIVPHAEYREWLYNWLAYLVQRPGVIMPTVPMVMGGQGTGKDMMLMPVTAILGQHNVIRVGAAELASAFNGWLVKTLVIMSEVKMDAAGSIYNNLKDWTGNSNGWQNINEKFKQPYSIRPVANFIGFTNHSDAMQGLEHDDRRIAGYISPAEKKTADWYSRKAVALSDRDEVERVHEFLATRDISGFSPFAQAPDPSKAKRHMLSENLSRSAHWAFEQCTDAKGLFADRKVLTIKEIQDAMSAHADRSVVAGSGPAAVRKGLQAAGCDAVGRARAGQEARSLWFGPGADDKYKADFLALKDADRIAEYDLEAKKAAEDEAKKLLG